MRAALSILGLVIVFALVLTQMKKQAVTLSKVGQPASAASGSGPAQNAPEAVRRQLQDAAEQAAKAASEAKP